MTHDRLKSPYEGCCLFPDLDTHPIVGHQVYVTDPEWSAENDTSHSKQPLPFTLCHQKHGFGRIAMVLGSSRLRADVMFLWDSGAQGMQRAFLIFFITSAGHGGRVSDFTSGERRSLEPARGTRVQTREEKIKFIARSTIRIACEYSCLSDYYPKEK